MIVAFRMLQSVPSSRYSRVCNVLHLWSNLLIESIVLNILLYIYILTKMFNILLYIPYLPEYKSHPPISNVKLKIINLLEYKSHRSVALPRAL